MYAAYLIAGNVFINKPVGEWTANRKPEKFHIERVPGVAVNNGKRDFHLIKAREWYDAQPDLLR